MLLQNMRLHQDIERSQKLMNSMIEYSIARWVLFFNPPKDDGTDYINDKKRLQMTAWVTEDVVKSITPTILVQLDVAYKVTTPKIIFSTVKDQVVPAVAKYILENNLKARSDIDESRSNTNPANIITSF